VLDSIQTLLRHERKYYRCNDYVHQQFEREQQQLRRRRSSSSAVWSPLHVVAECANLVTDGRLTSTTTSYRDEDTCHVDTRGATVTVAAAAASLSSPTSVVGVKPPSARRIQDLLYASSYASSPDAPSPSAYHHRPSQRKQVPPPPPKQLQRPPQQQQVVVLEWHCRFALWRRQMFDWSCAVTDRFDIPREVVAIAFDILDRYVALECEAQGDDDTEDYNDDDDYDDDDAVVLTRQDFQLFAMVSLYMAIKMSVSYRKLSISVLMEMARGFYSVEDITSTELDILHALKWHIHAPTVMTYCRLYMALFPPAPRISSTDTDTTTINNNNNNQEKKNYEMEASCQVLSELVVADSYFINKSNASVALAVLLLTARRQGRSVVDTNQFMSQLEQLPPQQHCCTDGSSGGGGGTDLLQEITTSSLSPSLQLLLLPPPEGGGDFESILNRLESLQVPHQQQQRGGGGSTRTDKGGR
jgi:Cyclin, N-terminal domain